MPIDICYKYVQFNIYSNLINKKQKVINSYRIGLEILLVYCVQARNDLE